jgi:hypothetical protein
MDDTPNLKLPFIVPAQAQKHVTHNEALRVLDCIVQLSVLDRDLAAPPSSPAEGARYIVATGPSGGWSGHAGHVAAWQDGAWVFYGPQEGWIAWVQDEDSLLAWDGSDWIVAGGGGGGSVNPTPLVGVNTTADTTNRLAVSSEASLFDNVGNGHQHKINKAAAGDTASLLFQTGYSGRAEIGTAGDDKLHVKVSADGSAWTETLVADPATGSVGIGTATPDRKLHAEINNTTNNNITYAARLTHTTSGTPGNNIGVGLEFEVETANNNNEVGVTVDAIAKDVTAASEDFNLDVKMMIAGAAAQRVFRFNNDGHLEIGTVSLSTDNGFRLISSFPQQWEYSCSTTNGSLYLYDAMNAMFPFFLSPAAPNFTLSLSSAGVGIGVLAPSNKFSVEGIAAPETDNAYSCGTGTKKWSVVYAATGTINTSDERDKIIEGDLASFAGAVVDAVSPVLYKWAVGGQYVEQDGEEPNPANPEIMQPRMVVRQKPGVRRHAGWRAQDIKAAMDAVGVDFGAWGLEEAADAESRQWVRPDQLSAVLWAALRETRAEVAALKAKVETFEIA